MAPALNDVRANNPTTAEQIERSERNAARQVLCPLNLWEHTELKEGKGYPFACSTSDRLHRNSTRVLCPKCSFPISESFDRCEQCGQTPENNDVSERVTQSPIQAERRQLNVFFCDLVESTALSEQLDPEDLNDLIQRYQRLCTDIVGRYGGFVSRLVGDGILAYFGYPIAYEDDALRAVRAGLEVVKAVSELSALSAPLKVRVGIHSGLAVVGHLTNGGDSDAIDIVGETPNVASRLQNIAEPNTVVISGITYKLVEGFFQCRSLGAPTLKGVAVPIDVYSVLTESGVQSRFEQAVARGLTPFVNRQVEISSLLELSERARNRAGQVVLISGEAGIGKSRLVREAIEQTSNKSITELTVRCSPYYQDSALYPIIELLQRFLNFQRDDSAEVKTATLERVLQSLGFSTPKFVPLFAGLLSLPNDVRYPSPRLSSQRQKRETLEAIVAFLGRVGDKNDTWVVVEDMHWADPSTLELLNLLIEQVPHSRLFVAVTFRTEFRTPWHSQPHVSSITLDRLSKAAVESMIESLAGGKKLPHDAIQDIEEETEGVPLFVEEMMRMVLESGLMQEQAGQYQLTNPTSSLAIPSRLYDCLMARLDRLGTAKEVAQLAATIGKEFSYDLLRTVSAIDENMLNSALSALVDAELLDENLLSVKRSYTFRHALVRDAAYESLLKRKRREYHAHIAAVLEENFPETATANPELIAVHYTDAGLNQKAITAWRNAGQRASETSANQEAIRHFTKGLALLKELPETPERARQELQLLIPLGTALIATKGFSSPDVEKTYALALQLGQQAGEVPELFQALAGSWFFYTARGKHGTARGLAEDCLRLAENANDSELSVEAHHVLGVGLIATGNISNALEHLEQAIGIFDRQQHRSRGYTYGHDPAAVSLIHASWALWLLGFPDRALKRSYEAQALTRVLNHPYTSATVAVFAAWFHYFYRNPSGVEESASAAVTISTEHDFVFYRAMGLILQGSALAERAQVSQGIEKMRMGLDAYQGIGGELLRPAFLSLLADAYGKGGQIHEALSVLEDAQRSVPEEHWWDAEIHRQKGELLLKVGDVDDGQNSELTSAEECFNQSLTVARSQQAISLELRSATSLGRLWKKQGKAAQAESLLREVLSRFREGFDTADFVDARVLLETLRR